MFTLTSLSSSGRSSTMRSSTGETAWHGPHHSAQKSTITGLSLWRTSCSKVSVVTAVDIQLPFVFSSTTGNDRVGWTLPGRQYNRTMARTFAPLPPVPDHTAIEQVVLERWESERTFERLRALNAGGPRFSFVDGPITANNPMGLHHAWG